MRPKDKGGREGGQRAVLKINNHGNHGWGTKGIWGDQRDGFASFGFPKIIVLSLKFYLWSLLSHCFVHQIPFMVPRIQLFCPLKFDPPKLLFCPHKLHSLSSPKSFCPLKICLWSPILGVGWTEAVFTHFLSDPIRRDLRAFGGTNQAINLRWGDHNWF